jgi:two-component system sensor histidine kinase KdpD
VNAGDRPNPDALLAALQTESARTQRGRLKVFLGMCPGVGKTYAMLEAAQRELKNERDLVIGYVETHGRKETNALAVGIPVIPRKNIEYRGITLTEMDLDAVLARHPQLALVDELAHTNAPGSRHPKRWQDVNELLDAGIDVFTTLNVQHLESRADTVRQITGSEIRETVSDSILDPAEIELVDLPPAELITRLREGKVYLPERAASAAQNFFREANLTALRELALRLAADHVSVDTQEFHRAQSGAGPWKTGHRLMVAVSASPFSESLIRWTRRMADSLKCPWLAVHVENSRPLDEAALSRLEKNLALARTLGAEVIDTADETPAATLICRWCAPKSLGSPLSALLGAGVQSRTGNNTGWPLACWPPSDCSMYCSPGSPARACRASFFCWPSCCSRCFWAADRCCLPALSARWRGTTFSCRRCITSASPAPKMVFCWGFIS